MVGLAVDVWCSLLSAGVGLCGLIYRLQGFVARGVVGWDYGLLFLRLFVGLCAV